MATVLEELGPARAVKLQAFRNLPIETQVGHLVRLFAPWDSFNRKHRIPAGIARERITFLPALFRCLAEFPQSPVRIHDLRNEHIGLMVSTLLELFPKGEEVPAILRVGGWLCELLALDLTLIDEIAELP